MFFENAQKFNEALLLWVLFFLLFFKQFESHNSCNVEFACKITT